MKAYWFDNLEGDQRLPHDSGRPVDPAYLSALGVTHYYLPDDLESVNKIASERNYKNRDEIEISPTLLPNYEEKVKTFFHEHLHEDEEIRYILAGGGYFDVRSKDDAWVRLRLEKGDLMIMPAGIYHRFTTDDQNVSISLGRHEEWWSLPSFLVLGNGLWLTMLVNYSTPRPCVSSRKIPSGRHSSVARRRTPTLTARTTCRLPSATVLERVECCEGLSGFCIYAFACVSGRGNAGWDQFWNKITTIMNNVLAFIAVHISMKEGICSTALDSSSHGGSRTEMVVAWIIY
jgi:1,2-dihydroxy-3-keto-5-methylthiopentene dioxygenase